MRANSCRSSFGKNLPLGIYQNGEARLVVPHRKNGLPHPWWVPIRCKPDRDRALHSTTGSARRHHGCRFMPRLVRVTSQSRNSHFSAFDGLRPISQILAGHRKGSPRQPGLKSLVALSPIVQSCRKRMSLAIQRNAATGANFSANSTTGYARQRPPPNQGILRSRHSFSQGFHGSILSRF